MGPTGRNPGEGELWEGDLLLGGNEFDLVQDGLVMLHRLQRALRETRPGLRGREIEPLPGSDQSFDGSPSPQGRWGC